MAKKEETPGQKAERERLARTAEANRLLAQQREAERKQVSRRWWPSSRKPESPAAKQARAQRDARRYEDQRPQREQERIERAQQPQQLGRNESAVVEYLRRHPEATHKDIAFHAIYGGGTTAWEGLHRKTRTNATAEASRVLARLKAKGAVREAGYTLGGKPRYDLVQGTTQQDARGGGSWLTTPPDKMRRRGSDQPEAQPEGGDAKPTLGEMLGLGGGESSGTSVGDMLGLPKRDPDPPKDDDGPRDGRFW